MLPILLDETQDTPRIILDEKQEQYWFSGTSIPKNRKKFYEPVIQWVTEYIKQPNKETVVNFKMKYFNTSSTKSLLDIMDLFKEIARQGKPLIINWYFHHDDDDMYEAGVGFSKMVRFPFNFIKY